MYAKDDSKDEEIAALRHENSMIFSPPSAASLIDNRILKSYNFSNLEYNFGSTMQAIVNSGSDFIWGPSSYIRLEYTVTASGVAAPNNLPNLGYGTIMNIFKTVRLTHRSGEILEQVIDANVVAQLRRLWGTSLEDRQKLDGMLNGAPIPVQAQYNSADRNFLAAGTHVACIPLKYLFGLFDENPQFIPNTLLAGAKIELEMESPSKVFANWTLFGTAPGVGTVGTFKPTLVLDSAMVYQGLQKQLLAEQANVEDSGLAFTYSTYFTTNVTQQATGATVSLDVQQAATLCERITAVARISTFQGDSAGAPTVAGFPPQSDSFQFFPAFRGYQFRIGATFLPQQVINVPSINTQFACGDASNEVYANALTAWGSYPTQYNKSMMSGSTISMYPSPFDGVVDRTAANTFIPLGPSYSRSAAIYSTSLEKQANGMALTGQSTNNARILNISLTSGNGFIDVDGGVVPGPYQIVACLQYVRVAHLMQDSCVVDR